MHARLGGLHRIVLIMDGAGRAGEVKNPINFNVQRESHIVSDQLEVVLADQVPDIGLVASEEIINADHVMLLLDQSVAEVAA
jgi:hypothetical protein